jgi:hypothetical protein
MSRFTVEKEEGQLDIFGNVPGKERDLFGEELEKWFGTNKVYGLYRKFGKSRAERLFNEMKKHNDHEWKHFTQRLWHD